MGKYFKNVKNFDDLKKQYRELLKANHPDNGGDLEEMKNINIEFDALFPIWKSKKEIETGKTVNGTPDDTRSQFYTEFGWEGSNYKSDRTLKEIAQIVRMYVKEKYPTYKFSVRTSYASMCRELHVDLKESPIKIYKSFEELTSDDFQQIGKALFPWDYLLDDRLHFLNASKEEKKRIIENSNSAYAHVLNEVTESVIDDVNTFVKSYNYEDCDDMIDYFDVNFYYFGCARNNGQNIKIVPKTTRIKKVSTMPDKTQKAKQETSEPNVIEQKKGYTYRITKGEDSRDGSELWIVRIVESLDKVAYIAENKAMKERGGYYSKFKHGFLFRFDPSELFGGTSV